MRKRGLKVRSFFVPAQFQNPCYTMRSEAIWRSRHGTGGGNSDISMYSNTFGPKPIDCGEIRADGDSEFQGGRSPYAAFWIATSPPKGRRKTPVFRRALRGASGWRPWRPARNFRCNPLKTLIPRPSFSAPRTTGAKQSFRPALAWAQREDGTQSARKPLKRLETEDLSRVSRRQDSLAPCGERIRERGRKCRCASWFEAGQGPAPIEEPADSYTRGPNLAAAL
jgi:hypothetical protein